MRNIFTNLQKHYIILLSAAFAISACEKKENTGNNDKHDTVKSGFWIIDEVTNSNCGSSSDPEHKTGIYYLELLEGNALEITEFPEEKKYPGQLTGRMVTWEHTYPSDNGQISVIFNGTLKDNFTKIEGTAEWTWSSGVFSCSGITTAVGKIVADTSVLFEGTWQGGWQSEDSDRNGKLYASVIQNDTLLSGSITIHEIMMVNTPLKGKAHGNIVFFGDVDDQIRFVGYVEGVKAKGRYYHDFWEDEGVWEATWSASVENKEMTVVSSVKLPDEQSQVIDMAFDGEYVWLLTHNQVIRIDEDAGIICAAETPGNAAEGIACYGDTLFVSNGFWEEWEEGKIFKAPIDGLCSVSNNKLGQYVHSVTFSSKNIELINTWEIGGQHPEFDFSFLSSDGLIFYAYDSGNRKVSRFNRTGQVLSSFNSPVEMVGGMHHNNNHIWLAEVTDGPDGSLVSVLKLNETGDLTEKYIPVSEVKTAQAMAVDGNNIWVVTFDWKSGNLTLEKLELTKTQ
jgi:hypothetical protein